MLCSIQRSVMCYLEACQCTCSGECPCCCGLCVLQLLLCRFSWRDIFTDRVSNVHSCVVAAMNCLLIGVKGIEPFIQIWIVLISRICVLKVSLCCREVINGVQLGCFIAMSVIWKVIITGHHNGIMSCCETCNFWILCFSFSCFKPITTRLVLIEDLSSPTIRLTAEIHWVYLKLHWRICKCV
jgi:hypothetical protein